MRPWLLGPAQAAVALLLAPGLVGALVVLVGLLVVGGH